MSDPASLTDVRVRGRQITTATPAATAAPSIATRVSMLSTWETPCGIADYAANLVGGLRERGATVTVVPIDRQRLHYLTDDELATHWAKVARTTDAADVVHIQHEFGFFAGAYNFSVSLGNLIRLVRGLRRRGLPVVITFHTEPVFLSEPAVSARRLAGLMALRAMWRRLATTVSRDPGVHAIVHSRRSRRIFVESGFDSESVTVIGQGVTPHAPVSAEARRAARLALDIDPAVTVLGLFGFMSRYKGYEVAIEAIRRLSSDHLLLLVGGPHPLADESALETVLALLERHRRAASRVRVTGFLATDALRLHSDAVDIWLAPYLHRPAVSSSAAVSWALASGRPVIAAAVPAFRELHEDEGCLELVSPERPRELAFAIERLGADDARRAALVERATAYANRASWTMRALDQEAVYARVRGR